MEYAGRYVDCDRDDRVAVSDSYAASRVAGCPYIEYTMMSLGIDEPLL